MIKIIVPIGEIYYEIRHARPFMPYPTTWLVAVDIVESKLCQRPCSGSW